MVSEAGKRPSDAAEWTSKLETCTFPKVLGGSGAGRLHCFLWLLTVREAAGGREGMCRGMCAETPPEMKRPAP